MMWGVANDFRPGEEMPETVPLDENHPFMNVRDKADGNGDDKDLLKEFVARLKEKKEWQVLPRLSGAPRLRKPQSPLPPKRQIRKTRSPGVVPLERRFLTPDQLDRLSIPLVEQK